MRMDWALVRRALPESTIQRTVGTLPDGSAHRPSTFLVHPPAVMICSAPAGSYVTSAHASEQYRPGTIGPHCNSWVPSRSGT